MALFTCPECGKQVSDKAEMCPACGCPTEDAIACIKEEKRQKIRKRNQRLGIFGGGIAVVIIIFIIIVYSVSKPDTSGYFNGIKWGTTFETLNRELTGGKVYVDQENMEITQTLENFNGIKGIVGIIDYCFEDDKLDEIVVRLFVDYDETDMTYIELNKLLSENLTELYGESELYGGGGQPTTQIWKTENSLINMFSYEELLHLSYYAY